MPAEVGCVLPLCHPPRNIRAAALLPRSSEGRRGFIADPADKGRDKPASASPDKDSRAQESKETEEASLPLRPAHMPVLVEAGGGVLACQTQRIGPSAKGGLVPLLKEIMTPSVEVIAPNATAADAARKMKDLDVGAIPVCDGEKLLGMITDRDLVLRVLALSRSPVDALVRDAMTPGLVYCFEDQDADVAAELMAEKQIRRIPILSQNKQLVGMVSLGDLAVDGLDPRASGEVIQNVSDPSRGNH